MRATPDIDAVGRLMREVSEAIIMPRWRTLEPHHIEMKSGPSDLVTVADREAEEALGAAFTKMYPGSRVVGEETFAADPDCLDHLDGAHPVWIIDPIDGTGAFTRGEATFGCMVALVHGQELTAAWILQPVSGDLYLGEKGSGVLRRPSSGEAVRLRPQPPKLPSEMTGIVSATVHFDGTRIIRDRAQRSFKRLLAMRCPAIDYPRVLAGEVDFTAYAKCLPWDHLPGLMLLREVGYDFAKLDRTDYRVGDREGGVMAAPSGAAWERIRDLLLQAQRG